MKDNASALKPEDQARQQIDRQLRAAGWVVQNGHAIDFGAARGIAVREYQTDVGPADYLLFVDRQPVGVIEAKPEAWGHRITSIEEQSTGYANLWRKVIEYFDAYLIGLNATPDARTYGFFRKNIVSEYPHFNPRHGRVRAPRADAHHRRPGLWDFNCL